MMMMMMICLELVLAQFDHLNTQNIQHTPVIFYNEVSRYILLLHA